MKIAMVGASGLVGTHLLELLISDPKVTEIILLSRRSHKIKSDKIQEIICKDFDNLPRNIQADHFVSCLGTTIKIAKTKEAFKKVDQDYVVDFGKIAKENNAKSYHVISAAMADSNSLFYYNRVKGDMENEVREIGLDSIYFYHPSLIVGNRESKRFGEEFAINFYKMIGSKMPRSIKKKLGTEVESIAKQVISKLHEYQAGVHIVSDF